MRFAPLVLSLCLVAGSAAAGAQSDPRVGLGAGWMDAKQAARHLELVSHADRPAGFFTPANMGDFGTANSDLAFSGKYAFQGNFNGFQIWDISNPSAPTLRKSVVCPGGQGDPSVHGNLLFLSVEENRGRVDCGTQGISDSVSADRFRGVRIFDISDLDNPRQVAAVQTCRGSHTHTLVPDPKNNRSLYVYVSGTSIVRSAGELAGCSGRGAAEDPNTSLFPIEVIRVPLDAPQNARIVNSPRLFADAATGRIDGLAKAGDHGVNTQTTAETNMCHDITVYPEMGLAAGACSGNGILLDIRDPANPRRISEVIDPNFAYWHSATFSNDARKVIFTDEWGGGTQPRCQATDRPEWGANAIFTLTNRKLTPASYYKLPAAQTATENCVAHNGSLIPVPGRDIMAQAWYQGGLSVVEYTDAARPREIAFFDRGPMSADKLALGGFWSSYWYNGHIVASEIGRGLDIFRLTPSEFLTQNEIDAANSVKSDGFNPQLQTKIVWPASFALSRAYVDQLTRNNGLSARVLADVTRHLETAESRSGAARRRELSRLAVQLTRDARRSSDATRVRWLAASVKDLARR